MRTRGQENTAGFLSIDGGHLLKCFGIENGQSVFISNRSPHFFSAGFENKVNNTITGFKCYNDFKTMCIDDMLVLNLVY